ncbi:Z1 domain-containing protein [Mesorhizobium sp. BH1-1-5]|uniref:Z1 domain-containing protein n=1 Tax=Mesorhizobium sp. BH1-1-5 TaxID=2876661 RepID=UPI001CCD0C5B|nr:Z1 domain-containing protein [Mesorhizobium sp. BH1-1-5]MBZ9991401.1 Z1 domain-containing protein [Mesorhizobium sp. BH1-1-5]
MADLVEDLAFRARRILKRQKEAGIAIDRDAIAKIIELDAPIFSLTTGQAITLEQIEAATRLLLTIFVTEQGPALILRNTEGARPAQWYVGDRRKPGPFMQRYLEKLQEASWPQESIDQLEESTARILESMENPERPGSWDWRGLVVGDVQSGKTASYAGVVNRAADAGYRIIIILAGMHNILRLQTQKRFDSDFLGYDTNPKNIVPGKPMPVIGVGEFNTLLSVDSVTNASLKGDFSQVIAEKANFSPVSQPCVLVVKKNAKVLENLNNWIARRSAASRAAAALIIDDEADQASVDTKDQPLLEDGTFDEDYEPKRVNGEIRKLLMKFDRRVYVGYTATPFANIFIHDDRRADGFGDDLFPAAFVVQLTPPDDYFGPSGVFGTNDEADNTGIPLARPLEQTEENWIPEKHDKSYKPRFNGQDVIPPSLEDAIDSFLLSCAARAARGQEREHKSMLVHVSRYVDVHNEVHRQVEKYLRETCSMISNGDRQTLERLQTMWETDFQQTTKEVLPTVFGRNIVPVTWQQVLETLADASDKIEVMTANGKSKSDIDYDSFKDSGRSLIAIGGDKLSRGLTLEGLSVSYFLRISRQYDSLLQMGRWFGYRRGFADLCRLYTTDDMEDWFRYMATVQKELRAQFYEMSVTKATPKQFGLKVEVHEILEITSRDKQRHTALRSSSYAGEGKVQTVMFRDKATIEHNANVTDDFIRSLGHGTDNPTRPGPERNKAMGTFWSGIPGRQVAEYLRGLAFPPESIQVNGSKLATYITDQLELNELTDWSIFLATGREKAVTIGGVTRNCILRTPRSDEYGVLVSTERFIIGTALSPLDQAIDLTDAEFADALTITNAERATRRKPATDVPSGEYIRKARGARPQNGLLIIYPIDPDKALVEQTDRPVIGVVVSFPNSELADDRVYRINSVAQKEEQ